MKWKGEETEIEVPEDATLNDLKAIVAEKNKVDATQVRIIFHSQILKGNDQLSKYKIFPNDTLNIVISNVFTM